MYCDLVKDLGWTDKASYRYVKEIPPLYKVVYIFVMDMSQL